MEPGETREECEWKVQHALSEELDINDVIIKRSHRVKAYSPEMKSSKKLSPRKLLLCKLLNFADKAAVLKKSKGLKGASLCKPRF